MKQNLTCPKCAGKKIWAIEKMEQPNYEYSNSVNPFPVVARAVTSRKRRAVGAFDVLICAGCGYTEWYARDFGDLEELAEDPRHNVRLLDGSGVHSGPHR